MSHPFGFQPGDPNQSSGSQGDTGAGDLFGKMPLFAELQKLLSWSGGPVNWDLARQIAISGVAGSHRQVSAEERQQVTDALHLADTWLDAVTDLPSGVRTISAWTQVEWIEKTQTTWAQLCDPVAEKVVASMSAVLPAEALQAAGPLAPIMNQFGGLMFGAQVGQGLGAMAGEVTGSTDIGLPLTEAGVAVLLPQNVDAFADGLEIPLDEVRLYLALREAAYQRLYAHVPWLRQLVLEAIAAYARGIRIDPEAMQRAITEIDPSDPQSMQRALAGDLFQPADTPEQSSVLRRLETLLALVEGWVDSVVSEAAGERMPSAAALRETSRRLRASGGPAEQTFATLVGLELRPRRLREAATLWWAVEHEHGQTSRDGIWAHPDLLPSSDDLDDPIGFAQRYGQDPFAELDLDTEIGTGASDTGSSDTNTNEDNPESDTDKD